jgi:DNA-binding CsgD family transcriptional regulator
MRAALVALDLRRITGDDDYVRRIKAVLSRAPDAWFGDQLAAQDGPVERLSHAELVVLAHLLRGETAKGIGERLDRSPFTISNHTRRIFAAFEVNSRSRVIAICAELGITPEYVERLAR